MERSLLILDRSYLQNKYPNAVMLDREKKQDYCNTQPVREARLQNKTVFSKSALITSAISNFTVLTKARK